MLMICSSLVVMTNDNVHERYNIGLANVILGIKITRTENGLVLSQTHYMDKILENFNQGDTSIARTPIDTSQHVSKNRGDSVAQVEYSRIIGMMQKWISDIKYSRSTSGYVFTLEGAAISWKSSKQTVIVRSTMESEFIALDKCGKEGEWLLYIVIANRQLARAQSTMYNGKSRHIRRIHNTIRQLLSTEVISIDHVKLKDNIADPLTKGLSRDLVYKSSKGMGLNPLNE
ncbi:hypothetical protein OSB04_010324 [Centaurea solstitialis]|uniref:Zinc finger, CCHC-type n=1 Tax=Centaurea solstitialis TaxID=347529 RepID=A0AA38WKJ0_9ASTR|nr:hypothetical protein OSB04_010324 [Centaurea solstitialis]